MLRFVQYLTVMETRNALSGNGSCRLRDIHKYMCQLFSLQVIIKKKKKKMADGIKDLYRNCCRKLSKLRRQLNREKFWVCTTLENGLCVSRSRVRDKSCSSGGYMPGFYRARSTSVAYKKIQPADEVWTAQSDDQACSNTLARPIRVTFWPSAIAHSFRSFVTRPAPITFLE